MSPAALAFGAKDSAVLVPGAVGLVENMTRHVRDPGWQLLTRSFPPGDEPIYLDKYRVTSVESIVYLDKSGASRSVEGFQASLLDDPVAVNEPGAVIYPPPGHCWPWARYQHHSVIVTFRAGYEQLTDDAYDTLGTLKTACMMLAGQWWSPLTKVPATAADVPWSGNVDKMLAPLVRPRKHLTSLDMRP